MAFGNIIFKEDLRGALDQAHDALERVGRKGEITADYYQGFEDALRNLCVRFGIEMNRKEERMDG